LRAVLLPRRAEVEAGPTEDEGRTRGGTPGWPDAGAAIHPRLGHRGRTAAEVKALIQKWGGAIHSRAYRFPQLVNVLVNIATNLPKDQDPVLARGKDCINWYGDTCEDEFGVEQCFMTVKRPDSENHFVFINRMLVYIFATDESYDLLAKYPKRPFRMACKNQRCVNLGHIDIKAPPPKSEGELCRRPPETASLFSRRPPQSRVYERRCISSV
jgi:hypothetical protein